ncbi:MAG: hypothetical protein R2834_09810 [Rhodothermales bacterium]
MPRSLRIPLFFLLLAFAPAAAYACSCVMPGTPAAERNQAAAVFSGRVRSIVEIDDRLIVRIDVDKSWKGISDGEVVVTTATNSAACGYGFEKGKSYLIYAHAFDGAGLSVNLCSRTQRLEEADADIVALGAGDEVPGIGRCGGPDNIAALQGLFLVMLALPFSARAGRRQVSST